MSDYNPCVVVCNGRKFGKSSGCRRIRAYVKSRLSGPSRSGLCVVFDFSSHDQRILNFAAQPGSVQNIRADFLY